MKTDHVLPLYGLSAEVKAVVLHVSEIKKAPANYVATALFASVAALAGKNVKIVNGSYINYPQLYVCLVGREGDRKSPSMGVFYDIIDEMDNADYQTFKSENARWKKDGADEEKKPTRRRISVNDATFEKMYHILAENQRGIFWKFDELRNFLLNLNRYTSGDYTSKLEEIYCNLQQSVDRLIMGDDALVIPKPVVTIMGGLQPELLPKVFAPLLFSGFVSRWLFCLPNERPRERKDPNPDYIDYTRQLFVAIRKLPPMELCFNDDAREYLRAFEERCDMVNEALEKTNPALGGWMVKQSYQIMRLAGIVHLIGVESDIMHRAPSPTITLSEVKYAEALCDFYAACASDIIEMIGERQVKTLTDKQLLQAFNERFRPDNISELARMIGKSQPYLCRILKE